MKSLPYDVFDCPRDPPKDYPIQFSIVDLLQNWNPDDVFYNENYGNKQIYYIYVLEIVKRVPKEEPTMETTYRQYTTNLY